VANGFDKMSFNSFFSFVGGRFDSFQITFLIPTLSQAFIHFN
jgi:hypothetical protein